MQIQKPRGTKDYFGDEFKKRRELENKFIDFYFKKGYQGIETPIFEQKNLFVRSVGDDTDIVQKELFNLEKKSDEIYCLRPEFTAGIIRSLIEAGIKSKPLPIKVISVGPCFRYERPQKGRRRQFNQLNTELIGKSAPEIDAEFISNAIEFLNSIGIKKLRVFINTLGSSMTRKKYSGILKQYLVSNSQKLCELCNQRIKRNPLRALDCKNPLCQQTVREAPTIIENLEGEEKEYYNSVLAGLKSKWKDNPNIKFIEDPFLVRGLDYYTGIIFELGIPGDESRLSSIGGGGRYDDLVKELGGPDLPAIGMALGFERIIEYLEGKEL
jgi:histidyl-tRNA synthetase